MARNFGDFISESVLPAKIDTFKILGYTPTPRQKAFHEASAEHLHAVLYGGAAGGGKELDLIRTQISTPDGFKLLRDIHAGDQIFGLDGKPYEVLYESPIHIHQGYKFTFDDGSEVITNDEHLWFTYDSKELAAMTKSDPEWRARRRANRPSRATGKRSQAFTDSITARNSKGAEKESRPVTGSVKTTAEIVDTLYVRNGTRANHAIPVAASLQMPERDLLLDPYVLGAWLGDGFKGRGVICGVDKQVFEEVEKAGYDIMDVRPSGPIGECKNYAFAGLLLTLQAMGLQNNKHVPEEYLFASESQRLSLLQGLMDTDGCANKNGSVEFCNTNYNIAWSVAVLARSLGHKAQLLEGRAKLNGVDKGPKWTVKFMPKMPVFRLTRKLERLNLDAPVRRTRNFRYIVSAERVEPREMKCIKVASPDSLFLVTDNFIPTHNTAALLQDAIYNAANYPGTRIGCIRRTYPELEESFIAQLGKWKYAQELGARWNGSKRILTFPNGSVINFVYAENLVDVSRIQGSEYQAFYFDEGGLMLPGVIQQVEERLRTSDKLLPVIGLRISSNPGGASHKYLKDRFVTPTKRGKIRHTEVIKGSEGRRSEHEIAFITAKLSDNPHLNEDYSIVLDGIDDPQRRAAMRDGDWDAMVGQFFTQWQRSRHVVPYFPVPKEWQKYAGIDYGIAAPFAVLWVTPDNNGRLWAYRELYAEGVQASDQAKYILEAEKAAGDIDVVRVADPSMWGNRGTPKTIADDYGLEGCGIYKADNDRINGWSLCHKYLNEGPVCEYHASIEGWGPTCPMFHVFEETCPMFIETIPTLPRNPLKPEDAATSNVDDHIADAWRYVCMAVGTFARPIFYDDVPNFSSPVDSENFHQSDKPVPVAQDAIALFGGW